MIFAPWARAEPTRALKLRGPSAIFAGDPVTASVDAQGRITMGPRVTQLKAVSAKPIVSLAAFGSAIYAGTAGDGLFELDPRGGATQRLPGEKGVVAAIAQTGKGRLYAAINPGARVVAVLPKPKTISALKAKYIWALLPQGGSLLVATTLTFGRVLVPEFAGIIMYALLVAVLLLKPEGLLPARSH